MNGSRAPGLRGGGLAALALLFLTACRVGTSLPGEDPVTLEPNEAEGVTAALVDVTLRNSVFSSNHVSFMHSHGQGEPHTHPVQGPYVHDGDILEGLLPGHHNLFDFDITVESSCGLGGSVLVEAEVTGEGNPAVEPGAVHYVMIQTHQDCSLSLGDSPYVLSAAPYLTVEAHATNDGKGTVSVYGSLVGSIGWQAEAKGGTCEMELAYEASAGSMDQVDDVSVSGTFCDLEIDTTVPLG